MTSLPSIHVDRFDAVYAVPTERASDAPQMQRRLDDIAQRLLATAVSDAAGASVAEDEPIVFIEAMEFEADLDVDDADDRAVARSWAAALHREVTRRISRGDDGMIVFDSRAAFIASYVQDLLRGSGSDNWYYAELRDEAATVAQLITSDADLGRDVLLELTRRGALDLLLVSLTDGEVERIVRFNLMTDAPRRSSSGATRAWLSAIRRTHAALKVRAATPMHDVARIYLRLVVSMPEFGPDYRLVRFIADVVTLADRIAAAGAPGKVVRALLAEDIDAVLEALGIEGGPRGRGRGGEGMDMVTLLREVLAETPASDLADVVRDLSGETSEPSRTAMTRFAGIFLLTSTLEQLRLPERLAEADPDFSRLLLLAVLLQCIGAEHLGEGMRDAGVLFLAGCERGDAQRSFDRYCIDAPQHLIEALQSLTDNLSTNSNTPIALGGAPGSAGAFSLAGEINGPNVDPELDAALAAISAIVMQRFALRLGAFADSTPAYLRRNFIEGKGIVEIGEERAHVRVLSSPLHMVLRMAGFDRAAIRATWLGNLMLTIQFDS